MTLSAEQYSLLSGFMQDEGEDGETTALELPDQSLLETTGMDIEDFPMEDQITT